MTQKTSQPDTQAPEMIPLSQLSLSPLNPRQSAPDAEIEALADSIRTIGLMQNLAGIVSPEGRVEIVAGGRRLRALLLNAEGQGADVSDPLVPVMLAADEAEARAWASTENIARQALHPADEIAAYRDMIEAGSAVEDIAKAFAVTVRHVKGRLRLAGLAEPILSALRADEITLDIAAAYTVSDDPQRQAAVFEQVHGTWNEREQEIRALLTQEAMDEDSRLANFVGRAAYQAEGGRLHEDLFGEEIYFLDPELLTKLAMEKLAGKAAIHESAGWKWVQIGLDRPDYTMTRNMGRTYPAPVELSEEDAARYDALVEKIETETATEAEQSELAELDAAAAQEVFTDDQMAQAGVMLWIGYHGTIEASLGLIRPEDCAAAEAEGHFQPNRHSLNALAEAAKEKPTYSAALTDDLRRIRTGAVQAALLDKPDLVLDLLAFALTTPVFGGALPLGLTTTNAENAPKDAVGMNLPKALTGTDSAYPLTAGAAAEAFAKFCRKKPATRTKLRTEAVARIIGIGLNGAKSNPLAEMIVDLADTDIRRVWTPTEAFFKRLKAAQLSDIHAEIMGEAQTAFDKLKKGEKAKALHRLFVGEKGIPPLTEAQVARAAAWLPEGMAEPVSDATDAEDLPGAA